MRVAVVGYGNMGRNHVRVLDAMDGVKALAIEPDQSRWTDDRAFYSSLEEALAAGEYLEAVIVATPTESHYRVAKVALEASCDALVEKPFTSTIAEAEELIEIARDRDLVLACGLIERFNPAVQALHRSLTGRRIRLLSSRRSGLPMRLPSGLSVTAELATHDIDVMNYLMAEVPTVRCALSVGGVAVDALLSYGEVVGSIYADWLSPRKVRELRVVCDEGTFDLDYIDQALIWQPVGGAPEVIPVVEEEPLDVELTAFLARVAGLTDVSTAAGLMPLTMDTAAAALAVMRVVEQIERAA